MMNLEEMNLPSTNASGLLPGEEFQYQQGREEERSEWLAAVDEMCKIAVNEETVVGENLNAVAYLQELKARMKEV